MCGLVGRVGEAFNAVAAEVLQHRGPDDIGYFFNEDLKIGLGHTRLAIQDLSAAGAQPMTSGCGRWVIAFNGEIYNHFDLRTSLKAVGADVDWRSSSDTETLLEYVNTFGLDRALEDVNGMFAFALLDQADKNLYLVRDRFGEKPLYYGVVDNELVFASELKAIEHMCRSHLSIDKDSLRTFLESGVIPAPRSAYREIKKLEPGHLLTYDVRTGAQEVKLYWDIYENSLSSGLMPYSCADDVVSELRRVVEGQLIADVPIGIFLSGGIDSTLVAAIASQSSLDALTAFSISFDESSFDEAEIAAEVAANLGINHKTLRVTAEDVLTRIDEVINSYDEPFGDYSAVPTYLLSEFAKNHVTVALTGDGGDELFQGYNRHVWRVRFGAIFRLPYSIRRFLSAIIFRRQAFVYRLLKYVKIEQRQGLMKKIKDVANILGARDLEQAYSVVVRNSAPDGLVINAASTDPGALSFIDGSPKDWSYYDIKGYLHDSVLTKVDRAGMRHSLEARVPMLDHRFATRAWLTNVDQNVKSGKGKWLLRDAANALIGKWFSNLPKRGFTMPLSDWLRGPLRGLALELRSDLVLSNYGLVNQSRLIEVVDEHMFRRADHTQAIWNLIVLSSWLRERKGD